MLIGIIGGGAAGMMAAIQSRKCNAEIQIFDANTNLGRKLSATGAGRCNISNQHANAKAYFTDDGHALGTCFEAIPNAKVLQALEEIGIPSAASEDGWVYPLSYSAANVVDILVNNLQGISLFHNTLITDIQKQGNGFLLFPADRSKPHPVDKLIVTCGSPANPQLGARGELYKALENIGHHILPVRPALTPIETDPLPFHKLQGVRLDAEVHLLHGEQEIAATVGNIIITQWGLNGPGVMDISHFLDPQKSEEYSLRINFAPHCADALRSALANPALQNLSPTTLLKGYFPAKIVDFLLKQTGLGQVNACHTLTPQQKELLLKATRDQRLRVKGVRGFKFAQASVGGIPLAEVDPSTMESRICPGLFFAGEILNVLGPCGGFNLHWAFLSALLAAHGVQSAITS